MTNYGYGPDSKGWIEDEEKKELLAKRLSEMITVMKSEYGTQWPSPSRREPYVEMDRLYSGVRIRKTTHLSKEQEEELEGRADKIYHDVMYPSEPRQAPARPKGLPWRRIDSMLASHCLQQIQKDIHNRRPEALNFIKMISSNEKEAADIFSAWRVHLLDKMAEEHDKNSWEQDTTNPIAELVEDVQYYRKLLEKEQKEKGR